jgi:hypothetical protein
VLRHPIRIRILEACTVFDRLSPVEMLHNGVLRDVESVRRKGTFKQQLSHVAYNCRALEEAGCLEMVDEMPVRGASVEHFYRATAQAFFSDEEWGKLEYDERVKISKTMWRGFIARVESAMMQDTFDKRLDRWLYWDLLELDDQGWKELTVSVAACRAEAEQIKGDAKSRLDETGAKPIHATYGIFAFLSPQHAVTPGDQ